MLYEQLSDVIGNTPLVKLSHLGENLRCTLWGKCEFLNPGGSIKDRIAQQMIESAEAQGIIKPGDTLIEATSGNTGIGLAVVGASKGYRVILVMPEKMSIEKQRIAENLGAEIIRTPTEASYDDPESHINVAKKIQASTPNSHILDQYNNQENPNCHYHSTAQEIYRDLRGQVDMVVVGVGTGGTITGIAKAFKELIPECQVIGADPKGSILAPGSKEVASYKVEGIGYDFIPGVLQRDFVTDWVKTDDRSSFANARMLATKEGILCGGSSGAVITAALHKAQNLTEHQNCVLILADGVRNYLSKFLDTEWLEQNHLA